MCTHARARAYVHPYTHTRMRICKHTRARAQLHARTHAQAAAWAGGAGGPGGGSFLALAAPDASARDEWARQLAAAAADELVACLPLAAKEGAAAEAAAEGAAEGAAAEEEEARAAARQLHFHLLQVTRKH